MILSLLLQASTTPQPTPYAVYATLAVGVLSLIASGLNIFFSSKTAQKVVNLSTKTTREVAELSAQVSRESAGLAAHTAREIKEIDYKQDFYKKIIEKRFKAWEEAQTLLMYTSRLVEDADDNKKFPFYCTDAKEFSKITEEINRIHISQIMWMSAEYVDEFRKYDDIHVKILNDSYKIIDEKNIVDDKLLSDSGKIYKEELGVIAINLMVLLSKQLVDMHDVEGFLAKHREVYQYLKPSLNLR